MDRDGGAHAVFNVCTGRATSVLDLANGIAKACGVTPVIEHGPPRAGDIRASLGDPSLARDVLGFEATTSLDEGLAKTRASFV
jgi:UDP-glucose 4-epimerase